MEWSSTETAIPSAQRPISFDQFPGSTLDDLSETLATSARIKWPPVTADETKGSGQFATGSKRSEKRAPATGSAKFEKLPKQKRKPPRVAGCYWTSDWKLRRSVRDVSDNNPFIGQLSEGKFKEMKADAKRRQLPVADVLTEWANKKAAEKGIEL